MNEVLKSLLDTGSGPSSSSTRNPNSSYLIMYVEYLDVFQIIIQTVMWLYLYSGCSFGSSLSLAVFNLTKISCGTIDEISAENGPPGLIRPAGICPSPDRVIPSDTSILNSPSSSSAQATWFCFRIIKKNSKKI